MVLGNLIGGFVAIVIGVTLMPVIADEVFGAQFSLNSSGSQFATNVTGSAASLLDLTTLFFALAVMSVAVGISVAALRESGLM